MRFAISVPNFGDYADYRRLIDLARLAEGTGWDGFFVWDHIQFSRAEVLPFIDPWVAMTAIALQTQRIRIGPMVTPMPRRRPWKLARETVSLDHVSAGRVVLGVGIGEPSDAEFIQFGEDGDARIRAEQLDEALEVVTGLWTGERYSFSGEHYRVDGAAFSPAPVQSPRIPIWVAGVWPNRRPFRRAAQWDGVFPISRDGLTPDDVSSLLEYTVAHRTADAPFDVVIPGATLGMSAAQAGEHVARYVQAGATWWVEDASPWAVTIEQVADRIRQGPPP